MLGQSVRDRLLLVLIVAVARAPGLFPATIDQDESMNMLVAREILAGHLPYVTTFQEKPLGMPLLVSAAMALGGPSIPGIRVLGTVCAAATTLILRDIALAAGLGRLAGFAAAALYGVISTRLGGLATNIEIAIAPLVAAAVLVALQGADASDPRRQRGAICAMGTMIGLAIWLKYVPALTGCVLFAWLLGTWLWQERLRPRGLPILSGLYAFFCLAPSLASAAFYAWAGHWDEFWYCNIGFMSAYRSVQEPDKQFVAYRLLFLLAILVPIILGVIGLCNWRRAPRAALLAFLWLAAETLAVVAPWKFYDHYFLLLLPPLCMLAAIGLDALLHGHMAHKATWAVLLAATVAADFVWRMTSFVVPSSVPIMPTVLAFAVVGIATYRVSAAFLRAPSRRARPCTYVAMGVGAILLTAPAWDVALRPDPARAIAAMMGPAIARGATLWVVNWEPVLYVLTGAAIPTRFVFPHFLTSPFSAVTGIDTDAEVRRILDTRPTYLVFAPARARWAPRTIAIVQDVLAQHYRMFARSDADGEMVEIYRSLE